MIVELNQLTIRDLMERSFQLYGNLPALASVDEHPITYSQMKSQIAEIITLLLAYEIKPGDRVVILGDNSPHWVIAYLAVTCMGAIAVPILTGFSDEDTRHIIRHSEAVAAFVAAKMRSKLEDLENSELRALFSLEDWSVEEARKQRASLLGKETHFLPAEKKPLPFSPAAAFDQVNPPQEEDLAVIIYTSGTTGNSKGVMLTHRNITFDVVYSIERFPIDSNDRFLSILPLAHAYEATGGMLCPLAVGISIYYLKGLPTPAKLLSAMSTVHPTGVLTVPLVVDKIYRKKIVPQIQSKKVLNSLFKNSFFRKKLHKMAGKKLIRSFGGKLRFFMFGGAALNPDTEIFLRDANISYSSGYGMTETSPIMTINPFGTVKMGSCGKPIPGITISIHHPDPQTGIGEIIVKGDIVMQGYLKNAAATREAFLEDGWLKTGDLGLFDEDGYLFIKGRSKNVIIGPSGENIYPEVVEQEILQSPYIQEALVYMDKNKLIAKVYLDYDFIDQNFSRNNMDPNDASKMVRDLLEQIRQEVNLRLPTFSRLQAFEEHPEPFEKTPTNKIKRHLYIHAAQ
ncbi:MAG TPA: AMP-binding protein [bacterium]|nr:AMP-binding protein [bacterium]HQI47655.1 AMP-binding protein [bacterium]HQJ63261.1 AMP-binding protein [bacterium]